MRAVRLCRKSDPLEEMRYLLPGVLAGVNNHFGSLLASFANVRACILHCVIGKFERLFCAVSGRDGDFLSSSVNNGDSALGSLQTVFPHFVEFDGGVFPAPFGVVRDYFRTLFETMERLVRSSRCKIRPTDSGLSSEMQRMLGTVRCFDNNGFCSPIDFGNGSMNRSDRVFRSQCQCNQKQQ